MGGQDVKKGGVYKKDSVFREGGGGGQKYQEIKNKQEEH